MDALTDPPAVRRPLFAALARGSAVLLGGGLLLQFTGCLSGLVPVWVSIAESSLLSQVLRLVFFP